MKRLFLLFVCISTIFSCISCMGGTADDTTAHINEVTRYDITTQFIPDTTQPTDSEPIDVAQFILDWEKSIDDYLSQESNKHPDKLYLNEPDDEPFIICYYTLAEKNIADSVIAKHDMQALFPEAVINPLTYIKMIMIKFAMEDFTQESYDKMLEIKNKDSLIERLSVGVEGGVRIAYLPNIDYYCKDAQAIEHTVLSPILVAEDSADLIIRSREEYDRYIDLMKKTNSSDYYAEMLEKQRVLYDEAFFAENALIITRIIARSSGSIQLSVNNVYTSGDKAYVVVKTLEPGGMGTADMKYQSFSISVKQSDIANVKELITLD